LINPLQQKHPKSYFTQTYLTAPNTKEIFPFLSAHSFRNPNTLQSFAFIFSIQEALTGPYWFQNPSFRYGQYQKKSQMESVCIFQSITRVKQQAQVAARNYFLPKVLDNEDWLHKILSELLSSRCASTIKQIKFNTEEKKKAIIKI